MDARELIKKVSTMILIDRDSEDTQGTDIIIGPDEAIKLPKAIPLIQLSVSKEIAEEARRKSQKEIAKEARKAGKAASIGDIYSNLLSTGKIAAHVVTLRMMGHRVEATYLASGAWKVPYWIAINKKQIFSLDKAFSEETLDAIWHHMSGYYNSSEN